MKVLIVDDEDQFAAFVRKGLEAAGFAVDRAATAAEGMEAALREGVSLVLLDVVCPMSTASLSWLNSGANVPTCRSSC